MDSFDMLPTLDELLSKYADILIYEGDLLPEPGWEHKIASYMVKTHQRKAKKIGYDVALEFSPTIRHIYNQSSDSEQVSSNASNVYIRITLYNQTQNKTGFANVAVHYISLESLDALFELRNSISNDQLLDHYLEFLQTLNFRNKTNYPDSPICNETFNLSKDNVMFLDVNFELGKYEHRLRMSSQFSISYTYMNQYGQIANIAWKLHCLKTPSVKNASTNQEAPNDSLSTNLSIETFIHVSQDQLVQMIDGIYLEICKWFNRLRKN